MCWLASAGEETLFPNTCIVAVVPKWACGLAMVLGCGGNAVSSSVLCEACAVYLGCVDKTNQLGAQPHHNNTGCVASYIGEALPLAPAVGFSWLSCVAGGGCAPPGLYTSKQLHSFDSCTIVLTGDGRPSSGGHQRPVCQARIPVSVAAVSAGMPSCLEHWSSS